MNARVERGERRRFQGIDMREKSSAAYPYPFFYYESRPTDESGPDPGLLHAESGLDPGLLVNPDRIQAGFSVEKN
jgi:hypothetical protein